MKPELLILTRNCGNCQHFDGEHWCALLLKDTLITGYLKVPALVVCAKHEPKDDR